jgi:transcriptional regulator with XRE-family HTH domain
MRAKKNSVNKKMLLTQRGRPHHHARMEQLKAYLARERLTCTAFAERLGVHPSVVSRYCTGVLRPDLDRAFAIEDATRGKVKVSAWRQREAS